MMRFSLVLVSVCIAQSFQAFTQLAECTIQYAFLSEAHNNSISLPTSEVTLVKQHFVGLWEG